MESISIDGLKILVPEGETKEDIKAREKIIKDFYGQWIAAHPDKKIWNKNLQAFIHVKFLSINETYCKAARSYKSTLAVFRLTEVLENAVKIEECFAKSNKNQKMFEKILLMLAYENIKMTVGLQRTTQEYVQYSISVIATPLIADEKKKPAE